MKTDALLSRLEGVRQTGPGRWAARCPAHEDRAPSLSIRETDEGKVLLHCFVGCSNDDVLAALGLEWADLYPDRARCAYARALADGHKARQRMLADITLTDYARHVLAIAAADIRAGKEHGIWDRATIGLAVAIMEGDRAHG